jgi:holo-[acyl-carrier protein] synthase
VTASVRVGVDLVRVSRISESLERFGERFLRRVFTEGEVAFATAVPHRTAERLAARFAAKEATMKAIGLLDEPLSWRDIEVCRSPSGDCALSLRGTARRAAGLAGVAELAVSLSHEGDYATAVVIARLNDSSRHEQSDAR